jgi:tetratricopeptide (TPR) repeat protein
LDNLEYIDTYFKGEQSAEETKEFEKKIIDDPFFAEEVAFYLSAMQVIKEQPEQMPKAKDERFKELYAKYKSGNDNAVQKKGTVMRRLWPYMAAAAIITAVVFGLITWPKPSSPGQLTDKYIQEHFETLSVSMGGTEDSIQRGKHLFNDGKLKEALLQFEGIIQNDTSSFEAKKYAGIVSLRLKEYDKAITYFIQLESYTALYANPGAFYHALTLLKRNLPGDKEQAKSLLEQVVQQDLEGKETAQELLKKW